MLFFVSTIIPIVLGQACANVKEAFQTSLETTAAHTTSQLENLTHAETTPGLYTSMKSSVLVNGEGSMTAQLTADDTLVKKLSKSVMIDLKDSLSTDAVEQIDEITVALHTKVGHKNGASAFPTMRPVLAEQVGYHTYVDIPKETLGTINLVLRVNMPVRSVEGTGGEMHRHLGYRRGNTGIAQMFSLQEGLADAFRPLNPGTPWTKSKLFPMVVNVPPGATSLAGVPIENIGPGLRLSRNIPLDYDFIVLEAMDATGQGIPASDFHTAIQYAIDNLPVDTSKIMMTGGSQGAYYTYNYLATYGPNALITHGVPFDGRPATLDTLKLLNASHLTAKIYHINKVMDLEMGENFARSIIPQLKAIKGNDFRTSLLKPISFTRDYDTAVGATRIGAHALALNTALAGIGFPATILFKEHMAIAYSMEFYDDFKNLYSLVNETFGPGIESGDPDKSGVVTAIEIEHGGTGYSVGEEITVPNPYSATGGQPITFTLTADHLTDGVVTSVPTLTSGGIIWFVNDIAYPTLPSAGGGSGLTVKVTEATSMYQPSTFTPAMNDPHINVYDWFMA